MGLLRRLTAIAGALALVGTPAAVGGSAFSGTWQRLPPPPIAPGPGAVSVWTGTQMLTFGRAQPHPPWSVDVAAAYTPARTTWHRLAPFAGPRGNYEGRYWAVWSGKEMLVLGPLDFQAFDPATNRWRRLPARGDRGAGGLVVWTGRELVDWGGGCCGDASSSGSTFDPAANRWRRMARSPLAPSQQPVGAWTGRELVILVSGLDPGGHRYPARLARAAAYDPATDTWRRIAPLPVPRAGPTLVWDGHEVLALGGIGAGAPARVPLTFDPATNRWRRLAPMPSGRASFAAVWTGSRLLVWGGTKDTGTGGRAVRPQSPPTGLAYDPRANRWTALPRARLLGRLEPTSVWTGRTMIVWGGWRPPAHGLPDGAVFSPRSP